MKLAKDAVEAEDVVVNVAEVEAVAEAEVLYHTIKEDAAIFVDGITVHVEETVAITEAVDVKEAEDVAITEAVVVTEAGVVEDDEDLVLEEIFVDKDAVVVVIINKTITTIRIFEFAATYSIQKDQ
eukprot:974049_1